jgi:hypothetical protein
MSELLRLGPDERGSALSAHLILESCNYASGDATGGDECCAIWFEAAGEADSTAGHEYSRKGENPTCSLLYR